MYIFVYENRSQTGYVPNLVQASTLPDVDLRFVAPYSYECNFTQYLTSENIKYREMLIDELSSTDENILYPICLSFFDSTLDYLSMMSETALDLCRMRRMRIVFYCMGVQYVAKNVEAALDDMAATHNIPRDSIRFASDNRQAIKNSFCYFPDKELQTRSQHADTDYAKRVITATRPLKFACVNDSESSFQKVFSASLWYHGLTDEACFGYAGSTRATEIRRDPVRKWDKFWSATDLLMDNFELHAPFAANTDTNQYTDAYWNFITESHTNKHNLSLSTKVFDTMLNLQPFIIVGAAGALKLLKELGYQTFGEWIDESYDKIKNDEERMHVCFEIAYELACLPHELHTKMMREMIPVLAHNQQVLLDSKRDTCNQLLDQLL